MNKKLKILYCVTQSEMGGAQRYILDLITHLSPGQFSCFLAAGGQGDIFSFAKKYNIPTYRVKNLVRNIHPLKDILCILELYKLIKKIKPDILHINSSKAGAVGALAGKFAGVKKIIYTAHGFVFLEPMSLWKKKFYILVEKISAVFKDKIICVSQNDHKAATQYNIAPEKKLTVIYNGLDVSAIQFFEHEQAKKTLLEHIKLPSHRYLIGTIAHLYPNKGLSYLIQAARIVIKQKPNTLFLIIGDGKEKKSLEEKIIKYQLTKKVILCGFVNNASCILKAFDIYVCSSIKEGFPYSILEAMAAELPIISSNVGGISEMLQENSAILMEPRDSKKFASAIMQCIDEKELRETIAKNAKMRLEKKFPLSKMINNTSQEYLA